MVICTHPSSTWIGPQNYFRKYGIVQYFRVAINVARDARVLRITTVTWCLHMCTLRTRIWLNPLHPLALLVYHESSLTLTLTLTLALTLNITHPDSTIPYHDSTIPYHYSTIPYHDSTIPYHDSTIPYHVSTIPYHDSTIPYHDSTIPSSKSYAIDVLPCLHDFVQLTSPTPCTMCC